MPFRTFGLRHEILCAIQKAGYTRPTPVQTLAIPKVMRGDDVIGIAQTGTGKTAAFVLPILHRLAEQAAPKRLLKALVLVPTRELAIQIMQNVRSYGDGLPIRVAAIFGGVEEGAQISALQKGVHIVVATPGRLLDLVDHRRIDFSNLEVLVMDEADRMLDMGFLRDIEKIASLLPKRRQTLMFSATLSKEVESLARRFMYRPKTVQCGKRSDPAETVHQCVYEVPAHLKNQHLLEMLREPSMKRVLVFTKMKDGANQLTEFLKSHRVQVSKLHSSRSQDQRNEALQAFKDSKIQVLVATDLAARGIDIDGVSHVVNYDFPVNPEDYVHRIGRTGRAEAHGEAISFVPEYDLNLLNFLELTIGRRLTRKKLKGFNYSTPAPRFQPGAKPPKRDWRKRTREREQKSVETTKESPVAKVRMFGEAKSKKRKKP